MTEQLKNCPACGSTASEDWEDGGSNANKLSFFISCDSENCPVRTTSDYGSLSPETIAAWNTRAALTVTPQEAAKVLLDCDRFSDAVCEQMGEAPGDLEDVLEALRAISEDSQ